MRDQIVKFISAQTSVTVCCVDQENNPWCFTCFFAVEEREMLLFYKTHDDTRHARMLVQHGKVSGTILPDKLNKLMVQGLQFEGLQLPAGDPLAAGASAFYHQRHPIARTRAGSMCCIRLDYLKMTDSTLGFGKKLTWKREQEEMGNK